jgi:hypothetical protein
VWHITQGFIYSSGKAGAFFGRSGALFGKKLTSKVATA